MKNNNINKIDILSLSYENIEKKVSEIGEPKFRSGQIFDWLHVKRVSDFSEMTNLSKDLREKLEKSFFIDTLEIENKLVSKNDGTIKYLYKLSDNECIETVFMKYNHGNSLCISIQVGCKMGCTFCASTLAGFKRNLTIAEMINQVYITEKDTGEKIGNIVLMGIGEPLDNFSNVVDFLHLISHKKGKNISMRNMTVSTCGIIEKIEELQKLDLNITLAISLHSSNQKMRELTMPIAMVNRYDKLIQAAKDYANFTGRRVTYEYALIKGVNDSKENANELAKSLKGSLAHVNLIPINEIDETWYKKSTGKAMEDFKNILLSNGVSATIRRTLGTDIKAACGQLRLNAKKN